jgi:hypothetical protein
MTTKQIFCCMCIKPILANQRVLSSAKCIQRNGNYSHKICQPCWWGSFAIETACHDCPGCLPIIKKPFEFIVDLTNNNDE